MRRKAKFVYFLLAILFAITFAFLGVGSGSSGLSDLFTNINIFHHCGTSVSSAQKEIQRSTRTPPKGYRKLATAYEGKAETASAITALQQYVALKKKDGKALSELAGLQLSQAADYQNQYGDAYQSSSRCRRAPRSSRPGSSARRSARTRSSSPSRRSPAQNAQNLGQRMSLATPTRSRPTSSWRSCSPKTRTPSSSSATRRRPPRRSPARPTFNLTAVAAYKAYLKLSPDASTAAQVRALIKQLQPAPAKKHSNGTSRHFVGSAWLDSRRCAGSL